MEKRKREKKKMWKVEKETLINNTFKKYIKMKKREIKNPKCRKKKKCIIGEQKGVTKMHIQNTAS